MLILKTWFGWSHSHFVIGTLTQSPLDDCTLNSSSWIEIQYENGPTLSIILIPHCHSHMFKGIHVFFSIFCIHCKDIFFGQMKRLIRISSASVILSRLWNISIWSLFSLLALAYFRSHDSSSLEHTAIMFSTPHFTDRCLNKISIAQYTAIRLCLSYIIC